MKKIIISLVLTLDVSNFVFGALPKTLYVVNGLAETLSKINLENGSVTNHITTLGVAPNQVVVKGTRAYVVNSLSSNIQIIDLTADTTLGFISLGANRNPWAIAFLDSQIAFVTNFAANTLSKIDVMAETVLAEFPVGQSPEGLYIMNGKVFICNTGFNPNDFSYGQGTVAVFDPQADTAVATINVGKNPQALKRDYQGELYAACTGDYGAVEGSVYVINPNTNSVIDNILIGGTPNTVGISWDGTAYLSAGGFITDGLVYTFHSQTDSVLRGEANPILVDLGATDVLVDKSGFCYVACFSSSTVQKIDAAGNILDTFSVGDGPTSLSIFDPRKIGDANGDGNTQLADIIFMVNFIFKGENLPNPPAFGDLNCDRKVNLGDIIYLVNFIFKGGAPACDI
ncbi:MAG: hypothetical protein RBG1_1C00001G1385 [candidate division Zixibacteria bacterium RBG-1]|nr:MAG: hypothetical protein RBG1_1C00001G1385 [candidate division Zixibacteria bacterium RBG-1]OGC85543.1 MAG: hypothetical protein A2V73_06275 [candidate division Zixibacteria bacterium RBG_19FT_COMBO_42_43]